MSLLLTSALIARFYSRGRSTGWVGNRNELKKDPVARRERENHETPPY